jgi:hypothetical protein
MSRLSVGLSALCLIMPGLAAPAMAQDQKVTRMSQPVVVRVFYNCTGRPNAAGYAYNGTLSLRETTLNRCGNPRQPAIEAVYTPRYGFRGTDEVVFTAGTGERLKVTVR